MDEDSPNQASSHPVMLTGMLSVLRGNIKVDLFVTGEIVRK
jgi:hypothetical protein